MSTRKRVLFVLILAAFLALTLACGGVSTTASGMDWVEQQHQRVMDNPALLVP